MTLPNPTSPLAVCVIIPTHRRADMLRRLLDSLEAQTLPHDQFEVVIVATENDIAFEVVKSFSTTASIKVRCASIPNDPWKGRSASAKRNFGVTQSAAPWIAFIDDDCTANPNWLQGASDHFQNPSAGGIEGKKEIPKPPRDTLVYRGLLLFTNPRGFQTCNMFYRRDVFETLGGFDLAFPYYLEDSDLAWSVLDAGHEIPFAQTAIAYHPVPPPHPWKMLDDARRAVLMPHLYKKHPTQYRGSGVKVLRWSHWVYLLLQAAILLALITQFFWLAAALVILMVAFWAMHSYKLFRGCATTTHEFWVTHALLPICPIVKWVGLNRGNIKNRVWLWT